jgi:ATP-dependent DNA helicase RecG
LAALGQWRVVGKMSRLATIMDVELLGRLLREDESDRVEKTISLEKTDKFGEAICAFANDLAGNKAPGYLFIGAKPDGSADPARPITDAFLCKVADLRSSGNLLPQPVMTVQKHALGGGEMAVVEVFPADLPPVRYKGQIWVRVAASRRVANEAEERRLTERRAASARTWDARPCERATLDDLLLDLFTLNYRLHAIDRRVIAENHRSIEDQLAALRFYDRRGQAPTCGGVLLFGERPRALFDGAYVQYVRFAGAEMSSDVVVEREIGGDLLTVMRELDRLAEEVAAGRPVSTGTADRPELAYPPRALHEVFMNAVIHRDYERSSPIRINHFSDRIEVISPGGLYGDLTPEEFSNHAGTAYRNPVLAEAAKVLGFVNRFGRGIALIQAELARNGSPAAEFKPTPGYFLVVVRDRRGGG